MDCGDRITIEPVKRGGKPCIRGMRMIINDAPRNRLVGFLQTMPTVSVCLFFQAKGLSHAGG